MATEKLFRQIINDWDSDYEATSQLKPGIAYLYFLRAEFRHLISQQGKGSLLFLNVEKEEQMDEWPIFSPTKTKHLRINTRDSSSEILIMLL